MNWVPVSNKVDPDHETPLREKLKLQTMLGRAGGARIGKYRGLCLAVRHSRGELSNNEGVRPNMTQGLQFVTVCACCVTAVPTGGVLGTCCPFAATT